MNIKKFRHACLVIEKAGRSIVVDPGVWTTDLVIPNNVAGIIVTHSHSDHFSPELITQILSKNPSAVVYGHSTILDQLNGVNYDSAEAGQTTQIADFEITFTGGAHAIVHGAKPYLPNLGIYIDGEFYYPGDSLDMPGGPVTTLALPVSAPWLKLTEALYFLEALKPDKFFATHNALLSVEGQAVIDSWLQNTADSLGLDYEMR